MEEMLVSLNINNPGSTVLFEQADAVFKHVLEGHNRGGELAQLSSYNAFDNKA